MDKRLTIEELSRQPLILSSIDLGTRYFTDLSGKDIFNTDQVQASAMVRIAAALEAQTELMRATRAGFTAEQLEQSETNLFHAVQDKESRLVTINFLATTPAIAMLFVRNIAEVVKVAMEAAAQQEGGPQHG
ncbi:hypothetical protein GO988_11330 [Hymenobacter sp. HMF4947]|uniref:Uncharacterized protein n=1 Tax=Hymenobacter ginkgonis TaxID=2682976 RepID=A0A7K1TES7_9BACT|nr:hypothetical protein [Hymenobacter ginkgonis]MVN76916.1 hypothetical protein [Hymenobacter ginkgonis]